LLVDTSRYKKEYETLMYRLAIIFTDAKVALWIANSEYRSLNQGDHSYD
jgi:hypothetical protein